MNESDFNRQLEKTGDELHLATKRWVARRQRRRRVAVGVCSTVVVAGIAVGVGLNTGSSGTEPAAAQVLQRAAEVASTQPKGKRGKYFYTETVITKRKRTRSTGDPLVTTQLSEQWAASDGSGRQVVYAPEEVQPTTTTPPADPQTTTPEAPPTTTAPGTGSSAPGSAPDSAVTAPTRKPRGPKRIRRYRKGSITAGELTSFSTELRDSVLAQYGQSASGLVRLSADQKRFDRVVLAAVRTTADRLTSSGHASQRDVDSQAFSLVASMLGQWGEAMPPQLSAAFYRFAATLKGTTVDDNFTDINGRRGISLTQGDATIVIDPDTYELQATSYRQGDSEVTIETKRTAIVDNSKSRPSGS